MANQELSRRLFITRSGAGFGAAGLLSCLPEIIAAQEHAHHAAQFATPPKFEFFTPGQAVEVEAIAAQIIPTDDTPGAREARVIYFIDRAMMTFAAADGVTLVEGLKQLPPRVRKRFKTSKKFSELRPEQQIALLKTIEKSPLFELIRTLTITGMFANPEYGGNYDQMGWKLIGFENKFYFEPPFGFYDGEDKGHFRER